MAAKQKDLDIGRSLTYFFRLPDWQDRTIFLGGLAVATGLVYILGLVLAFIPLIGVFIFCGLMILVPLMTVLLNFYLDGYQLELIEAISSGKDVTSVKASANYQQRLMHGLKLGLANVVYNIPLIIVGVVSYAVFLAPVMFLAAFGDNNPESTTVAEELATLSLFGSTMLFYGVAALAWIYQVLIEYVINPLMIVMYYKERSIRGALRIKKMWKLLQSRWMHVLVYALLLFAISMMIGILTMVSGILIFLCIGLLLLPVIVAISRTYLVHVKADLIAQMLD